MTFSHRQGHSSSVSLWKCDLSYSCAALDEISTHIARRAVPQRHWAAFIVNIKYFFLFFSITASVIKTFSTSHRNILLLSGNWLHADRSSAFYTGSLMTVPIRGATTFSKLGVQFLGLGYCTEQNADGIPSFVQCSLQLRKKLGWSVQILGGSGPPRPPVVAPLPPPLSTNSSDLDRSCK